MTKTTLLLGASGFLGRRLFAVRPGGPLVGTFYEHPLTGGEFLNLCDPSAITALLRRVSPSVVLYVAGLADVDACELDPALAWRLNAQAAAEVAAHPGLRTVYVSTDYVFDGRRGRYREDDEPAPLNTYARSKLAGERAVLAADPRNVVVRVSGLYDSRGVKGLDFSAPQHGPHLAEDDRLSCPVHIDDVASAVRLLLAKGEGGVYHVAGPDVLSRYEFQQLAALHFAQMPAVLPVSSSPERAAPRPRDSSLHTERMRALGWQPRRVCEWLAPLRGQGPGESPENVAPHERREGVEALLIDCVGGLLTPRAWLSPDAALAEIDGKCASAEAGRELWEEAARSFGLDRTDLLGLQERIALRYAPNPAVWNRLRAWRMRYNLALVNNGPAATFRLWIGKYGLDRVFDVLANSEEMGLRKPSAEFFLGVALRLRVAPGRCVLLDDDARNVAGARRCGMRAIQTVPLNRRPLCEHEVPDPLEAPPGASIPGKGGEGHAAERGPDAFMFKQFCEHTKILTRPERRQYFMLSGGANLFPMSDVLRELLHLELDTHLAYGWYTAREGFAPLRRAAALWENYAAGGGDFPGHWPLGRHVAMTLGASQAVSAVVDYVAASRPGSTMLLAGLNYSLFERQARHAGLRVCECLGEDFGALTTLPPAGELGAVVRHTRPSLLVVTLPNNPSGEQYSEDELEAILKGARDAGTLVLLDQVGRMPMALRPAPNVGNVVARLGAPAGVVLVNSFSKSDAMPGFRTGYVLAHERIIEHVGLYQHTSTMNPPTVPVLPVFFGLVARCVHLGEVAGWVRPDGRDRLLTFARRLFEATTAVAPADLIDAVRRRLEPGQFAIDFERYRADHQSIGRAIKRNRDYFVARLGHYAERVTTLEGGFNCLVELGPFSGKGEHDVCRRILAEKGLALLTESCFRMTPRKRQNFWVRVSLAAPEALFAAAVDRLRSALANM
jgi:dTDP-4-dehydrorhamnose reductase